MKLLDVSKRIIALKIRDKIARREGKLDLPSHTVQQNRMVWNAHDWSELGEAWGGEEADKTKWKQALLEKMMFRYIRNHSYILEIGPGGGRWTVHLKELANELIIADI